MKKTAGKRKRQKRARRLMSGHISKRGLTEGRQGGSKKGKKGKKGQKFGKFHLPVNSSWVRQGKTKRAKKARVAKKLLFPSFLGLDFKGVKRVGQNYPR